MDNYVIYTDSACDMSVEMLAARSVKCSSLSFRFEGEDERLNYDVSIKDFYEKMRSGNVAKTAAVNPADFARNFNEILKNGNDILYLGFSSSLSTTFNSARLAASELTDIYPERKIIIVDTLAASAGISLLIDQVIEKRNCGSTIEEAAEFVEKNKLKICHWFTVDDLNYLKRGGRISQTSAFFGNILGIKPILHVDDGGYLVNVAKVRGRMDAIHDLAERYALSCEECDDRYVYISHADCYNDAATLSNLLMDKYGARTKLITNIGAVIGSHCGPGTLALFFIGKRR